ncbi:hypothetical protein GQ53DRAFT_818185 [Thozetella sp. PMI_491]|nr:hypothetical protein GQ53DRAFT_818185 [Thozetella sp. PMI_491]
MVSKEAPEYTRLVLHSDDEYEADDAPVTATRSSQSANRIWRTVLPASFILAILISNIAVYRFARSSLKDTRDYYLDTPSHSFASVVTQTTEFLSEGFFDDNATVSDTYWRTMFPEGDGVVVLPDERVAAMGLRPSVRTPDGTLSVYLMSGFHHMHCVSLIRYVLTKFHQFDKFSMDVDAWHHTMHCVDTLRAHIVCNPDGTLLGREPGKEAGVGQAMTCKNFDAYKEWAKINSYGYVHKASAK